ncbi:MAG: glycosyl hydrolase family 65 protein, partial [Rikenellaceae bacterium]
RQISAWSSKMRRADIVIDGDVAAQQGIRYSIFMLLQTYTGEDSRLNIGPKGFTGEKYGGGTYWDTEAYCIPFYMATMGEKVAKNLLIYRYNQLDRAIENGAKLGFKDGAALYPMVTMNGEECHNEWEITFEEIHRNGSIAYAIYNYVRYTKNSEYLAKYGFEVLLSISRFWSQRVTFSPAKQKYVILGVTGPNEYENNVNNNWYTNFLARWCMQYTISVAKMVKSAFPDDYKRICEARNFDFDSESTDWSEKAKNIYLPEDDELGIFLQQDGYMDKEQIMAAQINPSERPINQHWSWDRILRSCFIKQADVLQGIYFFNDQFTYEQIEKNFDFYESRTVHESSLSPSVHTILAAYLQKSDYAHKLFLLASRLDLDDSNKEVQHGLHITSMAGSWLAVVEGFGGVSVRHDVLNINPCLFSEWRKLQFTIEFRGRVLTITITSENINVERCEGEELEVVIKGSKVVV